MENDIEDYDHNPPLPPELEKEECIIKADQIGDTVFSIHWVLKCILDMVTAVDAESESAENASIIETGNDVQLEMIELDKKIEEDMCALWDMTVNIEVGNFLYDNNCVEVLITTAIKTQSPRLVEINLGILGNMASFRDLGKKLAQMKDFVIQVLPFIGTSESYVLVQVVRLIQCLLVVDDDTTFCVELIKLDETFQNQVMFILNNSLNGEVLCGTLRMLYQLLDKDSNTFCEIWSREQHLGSVIQASKQFLSSHNYEELGEVWHILNAISQHNENKGISHFSPYLEDIVIIMRDYVTQAIEPEDPVPRCMRIRETELSAAISLLCLLMETFDAVKSSLMNDALNRHLFNFVQKMMSEDSEMCV